MDEEVAAKFDIKTLVVIIRCHNAGSTVIIVILIVLRNKRLIKYLHNETVSFDSQLYT